MKKELRLKIQGKAFEMFRDWTANAKIEHPDYDFTIIDETVLVDDLASSIQSAVNSLKERKKTQRKEIPGFDIGFIWGFIGANLNGHWVHEYIRKRSNDYKMLLTLKSLQLYLDNEDIALIKINEIYKNIYIEDVNFENVILKSDKYKISDLDPNTKINIDLQRENNILISLDNMITEKIVKIVNTKDTSFLPDVEKYFSENDVMTFITEL